MSEPKIAPIRRAYRPATLPRAKDGRRRARIRMIIAYNAFSAVDVALLAAAGNADLTPLENFWCCTNNQNHRAVKSG